jgi:hypothetical protein
MTSGGCSRTALLGRRLKRVQWSYRDGVTECAVSQKLLWLWHGDSSGTQIKGNVRRWEPVPETC